jgi:phage protein U
MFSQLGTIIFNALLSPTAMAVNSETNLAEHPLIENRPTLQRVGEKLKVINMGMFFDQSFCNPTEQLNALEASRFTSEVMPLIMGDGSYIGEFVIKKITATTVASAPNGAVQQMDVQVELTEFYDPDREQTQQVSAISSGFAMSLNEPATYTPVLTPTQPELIAVSEVVSSNALANTSASLMETLHQNASLYRTRADAIMQNMLQCGDSLNDLLDVIDADPASQVYQITRDLASSIAVMTIVIADVVLECTSLISDLDAGDIGSATVRVSSLVTKSLEVKSRASQIMDNSANLTTYAITQ